MPALSRRDLLGLACLPLLSDMSAAVAAEAYPSRPLTIVDAFAPGGTTDIIARLLAAHMDRFGQPVLVENRTGANGLVGSQYVARSKPDGYTLFVGSTSTLAINQMLYKSSFDPLRDLQAVSMLASQPLLVVVNPGLPVKTIAELIHYAKAHPDAVSYASPGIGNPVHLATELFKKDSGAPMLHVPYARGSAAAMPDLLSGQVQVMFAPMYVLPMVQSGKLRALAVTGGQRLAVAPELPTVSESGVPGYEVTLWNAAAVSAGTPMEIVMRLNAEIRRVLTLPEVSSKMALTALLPIPGSPEQQSAFMVAEARRWGEVIQSIGVKIE